MSIDAAVADTWPDNIVLSFQFHVLSYHFCYPDGRWHDRDLIPLWDVGLMKNIHSTHICIVYILIPCNCTSPKFHIWRFIKDRKAQIPSRIEALHSTGSEFGGVFVATVAFRHLWRHPCVTRVRIQWNASPSALSTYFPSPKKDAKLRLFLQGLCHQSGMQHLPGAWHATPVSISSSMS